MATPTPRRRFQFRLRTLMLGVTLLALPLGYVGWQAKIVRARKAAVGTLYSLGGARMTVRQYRDMVAAGSTYKLTEDQVPTVSWLRRWLGDEPVVAMYIPASTTPSVAEEVASEFPEATVSRILVMSPPTTKS